MSWYPIGRPVGRTIYPGMQVTAVAIHETMKSMDGPLMAGLTEMLGLPNPFDGVSLNDVCVLILAAFGGVASMLTAAFTTEATCSRNAGIAAAAVMAVLPAHLMRSVAGGLRPTPRRVKTKSPALKSSAVLGSGKIARDFACSMLAVEGSEIVSVVRRRCHAAAVHAEACRPRWLAGIHTPHCRLRSVLSTQRATRQCGQRSTVVGRCRRWLLTNLDRTASP